MKRQVALGAVTGIALLALDASPTVFIVLGVPTLLTLGILVSVAIQMRRAGGVVAAACAMLSIVAVALALETYYGMARGGWPTYAGFYLTAIAGSFAWLQRVTSSRNRP